MKSCFLCRIRTKSYLTTNEGSLHESYFTSTAPFMVVYMDLAWPHNFANYLHQQDLKGLTANKAHVLVVVCSITRCARLAICGGTDTASVTLALNSIMLRTPAIVKIITDRQSSFTKMAREAKYIQSHEHGLVIGHFQVSFAPPRAYHGISNSKVETVNGKIKRLIENWDPRTARFSVLEIGHVVNLLEHQINATPIGVRTKGKRGDTDNRSFLAEVITPAKLEGELG